MKNVAQHLAAMASLIEDVGPRAEAGDGLRQDETYWVEGGPIQWNDGKVRGRIFGPYRDEDTAHNYIAVKIERHCLANAKYHGEEGRPPCNDREYYGHPDFQYRIMTGTEYFARYFSQIILLALNGLKELNAPSTTEVHHPAQDGIDPGIEDTDEYTEEDE